MTSYENFKGDISFRTLILGFGYLGSGLETTRLILGYWADYMKNITIAIGPIYS